MEDGASPRPPRDPPPKISPGKVWIVNPARAGLLGWLLRYIAFAALLLLTGVGLWSVGWYRYFASELPTITSIERYESTAPGVTRILSREGILLAELAREHRAYAAYDEIPQRLVEAFLAAEDRRFFQHQGLDWRGLARALLANLRSGTVAQGGSTITQQVAKGFLGPEQTISRKLREAILSVHMEAQMSKSQVLEIYLNKIFLGHGAYGVGAAASLYFGKALSELTLGECALIAGLARAPSRDSPVSDADRARERRAIVLEDMVEAGYISGEERDAAAAEPIILVTKLDVFRARAPYYAEHVRRLVTETLGEDAVLTDGLSIETPLELPLQAFAEDSVDRSLRKLDREQGWRGPEAHLDNPVAQAELDRRLTVEYGPHPLDDPERRWRLAWVTKVERHRAWVDLGAIEAELPLRSMSWASAYDRNSGLNGIELHDIEDALEPGDVVWVRSVARDNADHRDEPEKEPALVELGQTPRIEGALYTLEHDTGYVVAMQGGHDYDRSQFNRAIQACRQPGSVFKAIYYALALDSKKYTMASILEDRPYEPEPGEEWNPQNIHGTLEGHVLLRNAFIFSLNLPSIRLFVRLGADAVVDWSRRLGFTTELIADRALSLGASCVRTDELTRAFGIYARGGSWLDPVYVRRVIDKHGNVRVDHRSPDDGDLDIAGRLDAMGRRALHPPIQTIDRRTAYLTTHMLQDVVTSGIGRRAQHIGVPAAGKSGTASKGSYTTDTWFVGFTSKYATAAWMGDDGYERSMGDEEASYTTATPMWTHFMERVVEGVPHGPVEGERPPGVAPKAIAFISGGRETQATLYFRDDAVKWPDEHDPSLD